MKLFIGISIPESAGVEIQKLLGKISGLRMTKPEKYHITCYYIGFVEPFKLSQIINETEQIIAKHKTFRIKTEKIDFSIGKNPNMIWCYAQKNEQFVALIRNLGKDISSEIPYRYHPIPHITLARFKKNFKYIASEIRLPKEIQLSFPVTHIHLWESKDQTYQLIHTFALQHE
jgi:RNA 2',3'-cyclic 3'-phosphodiesterase